MARTRQDRSNDFDNFYKTAVGTFEAFRDNDPRAKKFETIYKLYVCPGSRAGGNNKRVVEIFWGSIQLETITLGNTWKTLTEFGATLLFECDDNGFVMISIYPSGTDNRKPIESSISLKLWVDTIRLKDKSFLKSLWNDFMAYMECTSLDGNPTLLQRLRISYLRNFKHLVVDNKWLPTKFSEFCRDVFKWVLTVGLCGLINYILTLMTQSKTTETELQLKEINKNIENVSTQIDKILENNKDIHSISVTVDSIDIRVKHI